jgi:hypothetical protein
MGDYGLQIHHTPLKEGEIREDGGGQFAPTEGAISAFFHPYSEIIDF